MKAIQYILVCLMTFKLETFSFSTEAELWNWIVDSTILSDEWIFFENSTSKFHISNCGNLNSTGKKCFCGKTKIVEIPHFVEIRPQIVEKRPHHATPPQFGLGPCPGKILTRRNFLHLHGAFFVGALCGKKNPQLKCAKTKTPEH